MQKKILTVILAMLMAFVTIPAGRIMAEEPVEEVDLLLTTTSNDAPLVIMTRYTDAQYFVGRAYRTFLRDVVNEVPTYDQVSETIEADKEGVNYWADELEDEVQTGASFIYNLFLSEEYQEQFEEIKYAHKKYEKFVQDVYRAMQGRVVEEEGLDYWVNDLLNGQSYQEVINNIARSAEFRQLCKEYEIYPYRGNGILNGYTVILHSNDTHGAIAGFAYIAEMRTLLENEGASVILVDAGDFSQGTVYVSLSKGLNGAEMLSQVGYDVVTLGNHEFDYGYPQLAENLANRSYTVVCSDIYDELGYTIFDANTVIEIGELSIGFFGLATPETKTKANPNLISMLEFVEDDEALFEVAQAQVDELEEKADVVIAITHLGVDEESEGHTSYDLLENVEGIDFVIDGHSHTVMTEGENGEPIQSTGTAFANVGVIVIDNEKEEIVGNFLQPTEGEGKDQGVQAFAQGIIDAIDAEYDKVFAKSEVALNGTKAYVRSQETNLGDLITDSMVWTIKKSGAIDVDADHIVAVTNGGGIRADIKAGDVTMKNVNTVLPFGNTIYVDYITGAELLEALEASTYCTPTTVGGFPQVSGIEFTIDTTVEFDQGELYPDSTYYAPASYKRVTITSINGKPFSLTDTYAVITNNFTAAGGDTYYAFARSFNEGRGFDTGIPLDEGLIDYIRTELGGVIGSQYAEAAGRITIIKAAE